MEKERIIWSKKNCLRLIELYKVNQLLWNPQDDKYNDRGAREIALYEMLNRMSDVLPDDATIEDIRNKLANIRSQHTRAFNRKKDDDEGRRVFWCYDYLHFLRGEPETKYKLSQDGGDDENDLYEWSQPKLKQLVAMYKENELLWNPHHKLFHSKRARISTLRQMAADLKTPEITSREIVRKFNNLRTQYGRVLRKMRKRGNTPVWWLFKDMEFLRPVLYLNVRVSVKNSELLDSQDDTSINENATTSEHNSQQMSEASYEGHEDDLTNNYDNESIGDIISYSPDASNKMTIKLVDKTENMEEEEEVPGKGKMKNTDEKYQRFHWLGEQLVGTLNSLHNEETIFNVVNCVNKLLYEAETQDVIEMRPKDIISEFLKYQSKINTKGNTTSKKSRVEDDDEDDDKITGSNDTFDVTLTFRTSSQNMETLGAISKLSNLHKVQITSSNLDIALRNSRNNNNTTS